MKKFIEMMILIIAACASACYFSVRSLSGPPNTTVSGWLWTDPGHVQAPAPVTTHQVGNSRPLDVYIMGGGGASSTATLCDVMNNGSFCPSNSMDVATTTVHGKLTVTGIIDPIRIDNETYKSPTGNTYMFLHGATRNAALIADAAATGTILNLATPTFYLGTISPAAPGNLIQGLLSNSLTGNMSFVYNNNTMVNISAAGTMTAPEVDVKGATLTAKINQAPLFGTLNSLKLDADGFVIKSPSANLSGVFYDSPPDDTAAFAMIDNAFTLADSPPAAMILSGHAGDSSASAVIILGGKEHYLNGWDSAFEMVNRFGTPTVYIDGSNGTVNAGSYYGDGSHLTGISAGGDLQTVTNAGNTTTNSIYIKGAGNLGINGSTTAKGPIFAFGDIDEYQDFIFRPSSVLNFMSPVYRYLNYPINTSWEKFNSYYDQKQNIMQWFTKWTSGNHSAIYIENDSTFPGGGSEYSCNSSNDFGAGIYSCGEGSDTVGGAFQSMGVNVPGLKAWNTSATVFPSAEHNGGAAIYGSMTNPAASGAVVLTKTYNGYHILSQDLGATPTVRFSVNKDGNLFASGMIISDSNILSTSHDGSTAINAVNKGNGMALYAYVFNGANASDVIVGNTKGAGNLLELEQTGYTKLLVDNSGNLTATGTIRTNAGYNISGHAGITQCEIVNIVDSHCVSGGIIIRYNSGSTTCGGSCP